MEWAPIYDQYHVDLVLNGHSHDYERFARLGANGQPNPAGFRLFVVGTGGVMVRALGVRLGALLRLTDLRPVVVRLEDDVVVGAGHGPLDHGWPLRGRA